MRFALCLAALFASLAVAQDCIVPRPSAPPVPVQLVVNLPPDGGTVGCTVHAVATNGPATPNVYAISNAKCSQSVLIARQAVANDNGWNDGGSP
jgi:hypothetical protein